MLKSVLMNVPFKNSEKFWMLDQVMQIMVL